MGDGDSRRVRENSPRKILAPSIQSASLVVVIKTMIEIIEIKNTKGEVIHTSEKKTVKEAVKEALGEGISLRGADLRYTALRYANLSGANLRYANLRYADLR